MSCVLGGWNAVTTEDYDGGPKFSRRLVTVEGAYLLICWEPMRPCYTMEQCPTVQHMLILATYECLLVFLVVLQVSLLRLIKYILSYLILSYLNLAGCSGNVWWQTGPDSVRQSGFLLCSRHECIVKESRNGMTPFCRQ